MSVFKNKELWYQDFKYLKQEAIDFWMNRTEYDPFWIYIGEGALLLWLSMLHLIS